jgi:hypothetical protein
MYWKLPDSGKVMADGNLEQLIIDVKESLEREIRDGFTQMTTRFDTQAVRLERMLQCRPGGDEDAWTSGRRR